MRVGSRSRRRARVAGAGRSESERACEGARRRHRHEASFPLRFLPGKPGGGRARFLPTPAAAGERLRL